MVVLMAGRHLLSWLFPSMPSATGRVLAPVLRLAGRLAGAAAVGTVTAVAMGPDGPDDPTSLTQEVANWMGAAAAVLTLWVWWVWRRHNERTAEEARRMAARSINEGGPETDN